MPTFTLGTRYVIDESSGLQNGVLDDADVALGTLPTTFQTFLDALDNSYQSFATSNGVAASASDVIQVSSTSAIETLILADANNGVLDGDPAIDSNGNPVRTLDGNQIFLYATSNPHIVIGREGNGSTANPSGEVVMAVYLEPNGTNTAAKLWTVLYEPILHPTGDPDEVVDLGNSIKIGAPGELVLNFGTLASGQLRFGSFGDPKDADADAEIAVIVIAKDLTANDGDGADTVNTSQGGGGITIGVSNQMFNPGEGAWFTFVTGMAATAGKLPSAGANEANGDAKIVYDDLYGSTGASFKIVQIQSGGNNPRTNVTISAFNETANDPQGAGFVSELGNDTSVKILASSVKVTVDGVDATGWTATQVGNSVTVTGVPVGATVRYSTVDANGDLTNHNRVLIENANGNPFDIGGFALVGPPNYTAIGQLIGFGDDGPTIIRDSDPVPTATTDDSDITDNSGAVSFAGLFTANFGTDGFKDNAPKDGLEDADAITFALSLKNGDGTPSGLTDTVTGDAILLRVVGGDVEGYVAAGNLLVFKIDLDSLTGDITLIQYRAIAHDDPLDPVESGTSAAKMAADLIVLTATIRDNDGDSDTDPANIGDAFRFEDTGPTITRNAVERPFLTTDDTDTPTSTAGPTSFAGLFTHDFGKDDFKDSNDDNVEDADAIAFALSITGGDGTPSGLTDTLTNSAILLRKTASGDIEGYLQSDPTKVAFLIDLAPLTGDITLTQYRSIVHNDPGDHDEPGTSAATMAAGLIVLTATITDGDGDTDSDPANIGDAFRFKDDGPDVTAPGTPPELTVDESTFGSDDTQSFADVFSRAFGEDGPKDSDGNDLPDADATTYELGFNAGSTGLVDTLSGQAVVLSKEGDAIVGRTDTDGDEVFRVTVASNGDVTLNQSRAVVHSPDSGPDQSTTLAADNLVTLTATIYDGDGDHDSVTLGIARSLNFEDDAPSVTLSRDPAGIATVDETNLSQDATSVAVLLDPAITYGADGEGTAEYKLDVTDTGPTNLQTTAGQAISLVQISDTEVRGQYGTNQVAFVVLIDSVTGKVTLDQVVALKHPIYPDPDDSVFLNEGFLDAVLTVTDKDDDSGSDSVDIGPALEFKDDGPSVTGENVNVIVDDDGSGSGNAGGDGDSSAGKTYDGTVVPVFDGGADGLKNYAISLDNLTNPPLLTSQGAIVKFAQDVNTLIGYVDTDSSGDYDEAADREVFTFELNVDTNDLDLDPNPGAFTFTLIDQIDHNPADVTEDNLDIDIGLVLEATDGDDDPSGNPLNIQLNIDFDDDSPEITEQIADGAVDGNEVGDSVTKSLNGAVGFDENDANDESGAGVKTYTFTSASTPINGWPNLQQVMSADKTSITYYDGAGRTPADAVYRITLNQDGSGEYTFEVLKVQTSEKLEFDFTDLPSGQNLFGVLVDRENGTLQVDGKGLLVVGRDAVLTNTGSYTNASDTINTSKGGGGVTIGVDNQMFDPGDGAVFVFLDNPDDKAIGGLNPGGLTQNTADDADTLGFASTYNTRSAELEVVQKQGSAVCGMKITAYNVDVPGSDNEIDSANNPLGADVNQEGRDFIDNPFGSAGTIAVSINHVQVYDRANPGLLLLDVEIDQDTGAVTGTKAAGYNVTAAETSAGSGIWTVTVTGFNANDSIVYTTVGDHDAVLTEGTSGKWDLGGVNLTESVDLPDQVFDFTVEINDYDGDSFTSELAQFSIGVDGTGAADDGIIAGVNATSDLTLPLAPLTTLVSAGPMEQMVAASSDFDMTMELSRLTHLA